LWSLDLRASQLDMGGLTALSRCDSLGGLSRLHLVGKWQPGRDAALQLGEARFAGRLQFLGLGHSKLGDEGAIAPLGSPLPRQLVSLSLDHCNLTDATMIALADSPALTSLRNLFLSYNSMGEAGLEALASWPLLGRLQRLWLGGLGGLSGRYLAFARAL